ncbi:hypothetical protein DL735_24890 [Escherichia coli]|nr:hypothetical protein [Escherichia coli]
MPEKEESKYGKKSYYRHARGSTTATGHLAVVADGQIAIRLDTPDQATHVERTIGLLRLSGYTVAADIPSIITVCTGDTSGKQDAYNPICRGYGLTDSSGALVQGATITVNIDGSVVSGGPWRQQQPRRAYNQQETVPACAGQRMPGRGGTGLTSGDYTYTIGAAASWE